MSSLFDSKVFGESLTAWIGRVSQELKDFKEKLDQERASTIDMSDELRDISNKLAVLIADAAHDRAKIKALEDNQQWVIRSIGLLIIGGVVAILFGWQKVEYQLQHPPTPRSQAPAQSSPKL